MEYYSIMYDAWRGNDPTSRIIRPSVIWPKSENQAKGAVTGTAVQ